MSHWISHCTIYSTKHTYQDQDSASLYIIITTNTRDRTMDIDCRHEMRSFVHTVDVQVCAVKDVATNRRLTFLRHSHECMNVSK